MQQQWLLIHLVPHETTRDEYMRSSGSTDSNTSSTSAAIAAEDVCIQLFVLQGCSFIRCFKANNQTKARFFDDSLVYRQLHSR